MNPTSTALMVLLALASLTSTAGAQQAGNGVIKPGVSANLQSNRPTLSPSLGNIGCKLGTVNPRACATSPRTPNSRPQARPRR